MKKFHLSAVLMMAAAIGAFTACKQGSWFLWLIPFGCLFFILLLVVRSPGDFGNWMGWPLLSAAVLTLLLTFLTPVLWRSLIPSFFPPITPPEADAFIRSLFTNFLDIITQAWFFRVRIQAALILIASLPLIFVGLAWLILYPRQDDLGDVYP